MTTTLTIVDAIDQSTLLYDLNDPVGAANPGSVKTYFGKRGAFGLFTAATQFTSFEPPAGRGGFTTFDRDGLMESTWVERFVGSTYDNLVTGIGALSRYLRNGGVMRWQPETSALLKYIDFEPSPAPAILKNEERELGKAFRLFTADCQITIRRQPRLRLATISSDVNKLGNASAMLPAVTTAGRPDYWAWVSTTNISGESIQASTESYRFDIATTATRTLRSATAAAITAAPGDFWTASGEMWAEAGTNARGQLVIEFLAGAAVLATAVSNLTTLNATITRFTLTSLAAPATTDNVRMSFQLSNSTATAVTVHFGRPQLEKASTASTYRIGTWACSNDPAVSGGRFFPIYNPGDVRSPVTVLMQADAGAKLAVALLGGKSSGGVRGGGNLADLMSGAFTINLAAGSAGTDTTYVDDKANGASPNVAGNNVSKRTFATVPTMVRQDRITVSSALLARRGQWDVYLRCRVDGSGVFVPQLRWGPGSADPAAYVMPEALPHDTTAATTYGYVDLFLGNIRIVPNAGTGVASLTFEVWTKRTSGAGSMYDNFLSFVPADRPNGLMSSMAGGAASESFLGSDLLTPTSPGGLTGGTIISGSGLNLNAATEACGTPPNAGTVWGAARHNASVDVSVYRSASDGAKVGEIRVRNVTDGNNVTGATKNIYSSSKGQWSGHKTVVVQWDGVAGKAYQIQVHWVGAAGDVIDVWSLTHQVIYTGSSGQYFRADPKRGITELLDSSQNVLQTIRPVGAVPEWADPGLSFHYLHSADVGIVGYSEGESKRDRVLTVSYSLDPWTHH